MRNAFDWLVSIAIIVALVGAGTRLARGSDKTPIAQTVLTETTAPTAETANEIPAPTLQDESDKTANERDVQLRDLKAYVLEVMNGWAPSVSLPAVSYEDVAEDIALAAMYDSIEDHGGWNGPPGRAVLLAALAYWEGARYAAYVDAGLCNSPAWRASSEGAKLIHVGGNCDGGRAHSLWQIHPIADTTSPLYELCNVEAVDGSRVAAARCAFTIAWRSLTATGSLVEYTGEWSFEHPKADVRLKFAEKALRVHPFHVTR